MAFQVGDVWDVFVPFGDDPSRRKHRPSVVISFSQQGPYEDSTILVVPITSLGGGGFVRNGYVEVRDIQGAGLNRQSWVRARRLFGADTAAFDPARTQRRGTLDPVTLDEVMAEIEDLLDP